MLDHRAKKNPDSFRNRGPPYLLGAKLLLLFIVLVGMNLAEEDGFTGAVHIDHSFSDGWMLADATGPLTEGEFLGALAEFIHMRDVSIEPRNERLMEFESSVLHGDNSTKVE